MTGRSMLAGMLLLAASSAHAADVEVLVADPEAELHPGQLYEIVAR